MNGYQYLPRRPARAPGWAAETLSSQGMDRPTPTGGSAYTPEQPFQGRPDPVGGGASPGPRPPAPAPTGGGAGLDPLLTTQVALAQLTGRRRPQTPRAPIRGLSYALGMR